LELLLVAEVWFVGVSDDIAEVKRGEEVNKGCR
jgi:hypothetical protein